MHMLFLFKINATWFGILQSNAIILQCYAFLNSGLNVQKQFGATVYQNSILFVFI